MKNQFPPRILSINEVKAITENQLRCFYKIRNNIPNLKNEELYYEVVREHIGSKCIAEYLLNFANELNEKDKFQDIVLTIALSENLKLNFPDLPYESVYRLVTAYCQENILDLYKDMIRDIIPDNI